MKSSVLLAVLVCLPLSLLAVTAKAADAGKSFQEKAAKRLYPGGKDEEDLKVLSQVPEPALKVDRQTVQGSVMKSMSGQTTEPRSPQSETSSESQD